MGTAWLANDEMLMKQYRMNIPLSASEEKRARSLIRQENFKKFESKPLPDERIEKFHHIFDSLKQLSPQTLCMMIDDLGLMKFIEFLQIFLIIMALNANRYLKYLNVVNVHKIY